MNFKCPGTEFSIDAQDRVKGCSHYTYGQARIGATPRAYVVIEPSDNNARVNTANGTLRFYRATLS